MKEKRKFDEASKKKQNKGKESVATSEPFMVQEHNNNDINKEDTYTQARAVGHRTS